jgi:hypothetical protein
MRSLRGSPESQSPDDDDNMMMVLYYGEAKDKMKLEECD